MPRRWFKKAFCLVASTALVVALAPADALARDVYVTNDEFGIVSVIDTQTNQPSPIPIPVGTDPNAIAITPDGRTAYVANTGSNSVSVIDTQTNQASPTTIPVELEPFGIAITPDGKRAYVTNEGSGTISVIDIQTNQPSPTPIVVGGRPAGIAITPDGKTAYVSEFGNDTVRVIDTQTNQPSPIPIPVESRPSGIAITPDGRTAYVANAGSSTVSVIDTQTNQASPTPIVLQNEPSGIAITPDGKRAYVTDGESSSTVSVIDTETNEADLSPITVGEGPFGIAITPDGRTAYVASEVHTVSVIDTQTNQANAIPLGGQPAAVAIPPDQPPVASFKVPRARPGVPVGLDASTSSDPDGTISAFAWAFGDGLTETSSSPLASHVYARPGTYSATLTLTDGEGCSTALVFTGQTALCSGSAIARKTEIVKVAYPGVRVRCPKSSRPRRCKFKLQAVTRKGKRARAQSAPARVKVKAGRSAIVSLKPKKAFRVKLARARSVIVKTTLRVGSTQRTLFRRLKVVR